MGNYKFIISHGFGLALFLLGSTIALSYGTLRGAPWALNHLNLLDLQQTFAIANGIGVVLLCGIYFLLWRSLAHSQRSEEALRESYKQLATILDNSPVGFYLKDLQGRYLMLNRQLERLTGLKKTEIIGSTDYDIFPEEIAEQLWRSDRAVLPTGEIVEQEQVFQVDRETYTFITSKYPLHDPAGKVYAICGVFTDITERKQAEQERDALRAASQRFFDLSLDMMAIGNIDGYFLHLSSAWERTLGFSLEELTQLRAIELVHPDDVAAAEAEMAKLRAGIPITQSENRYRCKDGSYKWLSWKAVPFLEEGLIYGVARDSSERKQAEEDLRQVNERLESRVAERTAALRKVNEKLIQKIAERQQMELALSKSELLYRTLVETIPHGIQEIDRTGIITFGNSAFHTMLGYVPSELFGKPLWELIPEFEQATLAEYLAELVQEQSSQVPYLGQIWTKDGNLLDVQVDWNYKRGEQGEVTGFISVITDITERKQAEEALQATQHLIQQIADTTPSLLYIYDRLEDCHIYANRQTEEFFGCSFAEMRAKGSQFFVDVLHPDDLARLAQFKERLAIAKDNEVIESEYRLRNAVGEWCWIHNRSVVFTRTAEGVPQQILGTATDVTERKQTEEALRVSEERLRKALEAAHMGIWDWNILTGDMAWCANSEQLLGVAMGNCNSSMHDVFINRIHPDDRDRVIQKVQRILQLGEDYEDEFRIRLPDGAVRWLESLGQVFYDETGRPVRMAGLDMDITARKKAEAARQKTEQLYRTLASNFPNGVCALFDRDLRYTLAEGKGLTEMGFSKELLEGKTVAEIFPPDVCQVQESAYRAALAGHSTVCELVYGDRFYLLHALPVRNEQGEIDAGMSISLDITKRKQAELDLLQERNFVAAILDTAAALIVVLDPQGKILHFNRACQQTTGYSATAVKGHYIWDFFLIPEEIEAVKAVVQELQSGQFPNQHENYWVARTGNRRLISWSNTVLLDTDKSVRFIVCIGIDITERKQAEEVRRALEREQELSELRLRFFSMASHEFRTPLSTILMSAQILASSQQEWSEEKKLRNIQRIELAAKSMRQILEYILTINRAETGKLECNWSQFDLNQFCRRFVEEMQLNAGSQHKIDFIQHGNCDRAYLDEKLLHSILANLLTNAIKYSPEGGKIKFKLTCEPKELTFKICDRGIGIPQSEQQQIFDAFHRAKNIGSIPGSGLGLTVVKKCVEVHGGSISVTSQVGVGTTFIVKIPVKSSLG
ncbi:MAG TPA: PAS domain S-box protein [Allocoleopsis sp.]